MKSDSDLSRLSPAASMRSQLEQAASLKGEQVRLLIIEQKNVVSFFFVNSLLIDVWLTLN